MDIIVFLQGLPGLWIFVAILASLCFASENHIDNWLLQRLGRHEADEDGEENDPVGTLAIISGLFGILAVGIFAGLSYLIPNTELVLSKPLIQKAVLVGVLDMVWLIPYLYATKRAGATRAAPLFQMIPVIALALGAAAHTLATKFNVTNLSQFAEIPSVIHVVAAGIIVTGGLLLNLSEVEGKWGIDHKTISLMAFSSTVIAFSSFLFKDAALEGNFIAAGFWSGVGMFIAGVAVFLFWKPYRTEFLAYAKDVDKEGLAVQTANELTDIAAMSLQRLALILGPTVMAVEAMNAYQPLFVLLIAWIQAKCGSSTHQSLLEKGKLRQAIVAITAIAIGTVLIAL